MSPTAKRLFFRQMAEFTATEQERYEINCNRLFLPHRCADSTVQVLVACGQYDSFIFAMKMPTLRCNVLTWNMHKLPMQTMCQLQRRKETMHLFATFLKDESIQHLDGIIPFSRAQMLDMERRGEERVQIQHPETF